jgi:hypothetical protein
MFEKAVTKIMTIAFFAAIITGHAPAQAGAFPHICDERVLDARGVHDFQYTPKRMRVKTPFTIEVPVEIPGGCNFLDNRSECVTGNSRPYNLTVGEVIFIKPLELPDRHDERNVWVWGAICSIGEQSVTSVQNVSEHLEEIRIQ